MIAILLPRTPPLALVVATAVVLASCAPGATPARVAPDAERPRLVVVTGPTERPLDGLTPATRAALRRAGFTGSFGPEVVDRIAPYRDVSARRAVATAGVLGRIAGADLSLYVGVRVLDRRVSTDGAVRRVVVDLQLHAVLVEPHSGATLWAARDLPRQHVRVERSLAPLPPAGADPGALRLRDEALRAIAEAAVYRIAQEPLRAAP